MKDLEIDDESARSGLAVSARGFHFRWNGRLSRWSGSKLLGCESPNFHLFKRNRPMNMSADFLAMGCHVKGVEAVHFVGESVMPHAQTPNHSSQHSPPCFLLSCHRETEAATCDLAVGQSQ